MDITKAIQDAVESVNGSATFDEKEIVDEVVTATTRMILPAGHAFYVEKPEQIGSSQHLTWQQTLATMFMNYDMLQNNGVAREKAIMISAIRASLIANGAYLVNPKDPQVPYGCYRAEIFRMDPPDFVREWLEGHKVKRDVKRTTKTDVPKDAPTKTDEKIPEVKAEPRIDHEYMTIPKDNSHFIDMLSRIDWEEVKKLTKYLPIFGHLAFTKFEHHYISNEYFKESYAKLFKSLKLSTLEAKWNHADIIYPSIHWMGPFAMRQWCINLKTADKMPRPLAMRFPIAPAGTALITSTVAVLKAAGALPGFNAFYDVYAKQWGLITSAVDRIKQNPYAYHTRADLFDERSMEATLEEAKLAAAQLAPAAQAFINRFAQNTDLARIKAIQKHAEANIGLLKRYEAIFTGNATQARLDARTRPIRELLMGTKEAMTEQRGPIVEETTE